MRRGRRARIAGRLLGGILSAAVILGSYVGTGLTAYADEETGKNAGYHSEWVNGSWYEADGTRSDSYKGKWMKNKKGKWYQDISGWYPKKRWQTIDGKVYYFDADGYLECDAYRDGYYLGKDGSRDGKGKVPGWKETAGGWYFNLSDGTKLKNTWKKINGRWYFFDKNGAMSADSWKKSGGKWYYLGKNGAMITGWKKLKDIWYFLGKDGKMQTGWKEIDGTWYYFKADILSNMITYSTDKRVAANLTTISAERAKEIIAMNREGKKPDALDNSVKEAPAKPIDLAAQEDLTRFDSARKKKKKKKKRVQESGENRETERLKD